LQWIFSGFHPVSLLAELSERGAEVINRVAAHYADLSSEVGWEVTPPLEGVLDASIRLGLAGRLEDAIAVADAAVAWHPESVFARGVLGDWYMEACQLGEAEEQLTRALRMAEEDAEADESPQVPHSLLERLHMKIEDPDACTDPR
jgi:tetratricopeptide (TPR) repeat protein